MTIAYFLNYLADVGVLNDRADLNVLRDALAELGLYPETELADIGHITDPRDEED